MKNSKKSLNYQLLILFNLLSYIAMVVVNFLANYLPINDLDTGEISEMYPNLFTPAGFTFSIWGVIYLLLGIFIVYQIFKLYKDNIKLDYIQRISYFFISSSILNIVWIFAWHYLQIGLSLIIMFLLLTNLLYLYRRLNSSDIQENGFTLSKITFSIYTGWITIATIANVTVFLVDINWGGFGLSDSFWMIIITLLATAIVIRFMYQNDDWVYALVAVWAFFGIVYKRLTTEPVETAVVIVLIICMLTIIAGIVKKIKKEVV